MYFQYGIVKYLWIIKRVLNVDRKYDIMVKKLYRKDYQGYNHANKLLCAFIFVTYDMFI